MRFCLEPDNIERDIGSALRDGKKICVGDKIQSYNILGFVKVSEQGKVGALIEMPPNFAGKYQIILCDSKK